MDEGDSEADVFNCKRVLMERVCQIDTSLAVMAGDTAFRSGRFCAHETIIFQDVTAEPEIESSQRPLSSRLLERDDGFSPRGCERQPAAPL